MQMQHGSYTIGFFHKTYKYIKQIKNSSNKKLRINKCGHTDSKNRPTQETFICTKCGHANHADINAAQNILADGLAAYAHSNMGTY